MSRPRSKRNSHLPNNLYRKYDKRTDKIYYTYRDPRSGKCHGLGTDRIAAENDAKALNASIYSSIRATRLATLTDPAPATPPFGKVLKRHLELCEKTRKLAPNTIKNKVSTGKAWEKALGADTPIGEITVRSIVEVLNSYSDRPRMAQAMRSAAIDIWKDAIQEGWVFDNIPAKTRSSTVEVQRSRLTLEDFNLIHAAALTLKDQWIARSMELALVSAQRREDISSMEFRGTKGSTAWAEDDALCVIQGKTGTKLRIPLDVVVNGLSVGGVIKSCRDHIVSRWLIHHQVRRTKSNPGDQVWINTISKGFARARDLAGVKGEDDKEPPTFHEIRSLAIRLYANQYGAEFAQSIAGHKDASMTAVYRDVRGSEWVQVKAN